MKTTLFIIIISLLTISCNKEQGTIDRSKATLLFSQTKNLIQQYSDSLLTATDSTEIIETTGKFENQLKALNLKYPSNTDFLMTQGQQDTIIKFTDSLISIKNKKLKQFSTTNRECLFTDTIYQNSISKSK